MLRVAIIGCGRIADSHASQIQRVQGCEIAAVCDREPLMARQLYERFPVKQYFSDAAELLMETRPDVVHITTPPQSHFELGMQCLDAGCHLYVEKPFTIDARQAAAILALATERRLSVTVGHDDQFSHAARRLRALVATGYLGDRPVHMESTFCYDIANPTYARALLGDADHWIRRLPGGLLHNIISHGIARIAEFLPGDSPEVIAHGFTSSVLRRIGELDIVDELRVIISDEGGTTAYFTFSSQMRPSVHQFSIYGSKNGLLLDQDHETLIRLRGDRFKSYLDKFVPPLLRAQEDLANVAANLKAFLMNDFHPKSGMKYLIESFYHSIREGLAVPIPYREILLTARIMDSIFSQIRVAKPPKGRSGSDDEAEALAACSGRRL